MLFCCLTYNWIYNDCELFMVLSFSLNIFVHLLDGVFSEIFCCDFHGIYYKFASKALIIKCI